MGWQATGDVTAFLGEVGAFLRRERARNTVLLTVTEQLRLNHSRGAAADAGAADPAGLPLFGWWAGDGGEAGGAFMHTPPHPLLLTALTAGAAADLAAADLAAADLAAALAGRPLRGVNAHPETARQFAAAWRDATGCLVTPHHLIPSTSGSVTAALRTGWSSHFPLPRLLVGNIAFPGRGGILEAIMLIAGQIFRYVA